MPFLNRMLVGILGAAALLYTLRAILRGVIDLGGKRGGHYFIAFSEQPLVFVLAVVLMLAMGVGGLVTAWRALRGEKDE